MENKKAQQGLMGVVIFGAIAAVVAIIMVEVFNDVYDGSKLNGTTRTVFSNIPVFIGLAVLVGIAVGSFVGMR
jgi:hypothetical protein